jgi:hypothetical protein
MTTTETDEHQIQASKGYSLRDGAPKKPTQQEFERLLMLLDVEEACSVKWKWGLREHRPNGEEGFQGNPLVELHSEGLDALNYCQVLMDLFEEDGHLVFPTQEDRAAYHDCLEKLREHALGLVMGTRLLVQEP